MDVSSEVTVEGVARWNISATTLVGAAAAGGWRRAAPEGHLRKRQAAMRMVMTVATDPSSALSILFSSSCHRE